MRDFVLLIVFLSLFMAPGAVAFVRAKQELRSQQGISIGTLSAAVSAYAALATGVLLASWLCAWPLPITQWSSRTFGLTLVLAGATMYVTARLQMRSFRQTWALRTDQLLTTGIYSLLRHPQNVGWGLLLTGVALLGKSGVSLALMGVYVLSCVIWLSVEEKFLARRFGPTQLRYRSRTPAVIRLRPRRTE